MMPIQLLSLIFKNPFTSTIGAGLILTNVGAVLTMVGSGVSFGTIATDPHFMFLWAGVQGILSKDFNVTGGTRAQ